MQRSVDIVDAYSYTMVINMVTETEVSEASCANCGKVLTPRTIYPFRNESDYDYAPEWFCSDECYVADAEHREVDLNTVYTCDICGKDFKTKNGAVKCETSTPKKIKLKNINGKTSDTWAIEDVVLKIDKGKSSYHVITDTKVEKHDIVPVLGTTKKVIAKFMMGV